MIYSIEKPEKENKYNKIVPLVSYNIPAPKRCLDMILRKYNNEPYKSEVDMLVSNTHKAPNIKKGLHESNIILITDGGLVPKGNVDNIPSVASDIFGVYPIKDIERLSAEDYEVSHQGYNNVYIEDDPNRLIPLDAMRSLEKSKEIGGVFDYFISTTGVMLPKERGIILANKIAQYINTIEVDAAMVISNCGTSTRTGAYIGVALERIGIPTVQITNLIKIAKGVGINKVITGNDISYPLGNPDLNAIDEYKNRKMIVRESLYSLFDVFR